MSLSGTPKWLIVLVAGLICLAAGGGAATLVIVLTRDDKKDSAVDVAVGTAGLVNEMSGLLADLEAPSVAGDPKRRAEITRRLEEDEGNARGLIADARKAKGKESVRNRLIKANKQLVQVAQRVRRAARRKAALLAAEARRARRELELLQSEVDQIARAAGDRDEGGSTGKRARRTPVDLPYANVVLRGADGGSLAGSSIASAGDVNGDDRDDVIVAAPGSGAAYVLFGGEDTGELKLDELGSDRGFSITSLPVSTPDSSDEDDPDTLLARIADLTVAGVGDINRDGLADVAVGAPRADPGGVEDAGSVYVVFGSDSPQDVDAGSLVGAGFRIDGPGHFWNVGESVAGGGDLDGDDHGDLVIGGREHIGTEDYTAARGAAAAWVMLGRSSWPGVVRLRRAGARRETWRLNGVGSSLAVAGDVNGDGLDDVVGGDAYNRMDAPGYAAIVLGRRKRTATINAGRQGGGVAPLRVGQGRQIGSGVARVGDQNGDRLADVAVVSRNLSGGARVHVVFGRRRPRALRLERLGTSGAAIDLGRAKDDQQWAAHGVASAGDVDGDGKQDLLVSAPPARTLVGGPAPGGARIVLGGALRPGRRLSASSAGTQVVPIRGDGVRLTDSEFITAGQVGYALAGIGDVDGDGLDDIAVGAARADSLDPPDPSGKTEPAEGAVFLSYKTPPPEGRGPLEGEVTAAGLGEVLVGGVVGRVQDLLNSILHPSRNGDCGYLPSNDARISFLTNRGSVARVEVTGPGYATAAGIEVGDTESAVRAAYGSKLRSARHPYSPTGQLLSVRFAGGKRKIVFATNGRRVTVIYAGRVPEVDYPEGCS